MRIHSPLLPALLTTLLIGVAHAEGPAADPLQDAKEIPGFIKAYQKDDKIWFALKPEQLNQPFFFSCNTVKSFGSEGSTGSTMGNSEVAYFRKAGNQIQLIAKNCTYLAKPASPQARFVEENFSNSLIASAPAVTAAHPFEKAIVFEANAMLLTDIPGYGQRMNAIYKASYSLDAKNSNLEKLRSTADFTGLAVEAHYSLSGNPATTASFPKTLPDRRSFFATFYYSFAQLPAQPMTPRLADDRIGHFLTTVEDRTEDLSPDEQTHYVNRWRLEKKDPTAALSEPVQPIVYWIDRNVPDKYRDSVRAGILEWNKAFEKIGFKDAIVVRQQTEADDFDTMDSRHASVRWYTAADVGSAVGPSHADPRTGEILDADIRMADVFGRGVRRFRVEDTHQSSTADTSDSDGSGRAHQCSYQRQFAEESLFALDLLEAQGLRPDSPGVEVLAQAYIKAVVTHEVGHTLGLRHNFRGSTAYTLAQLQDPEFTRTHSISSSVMDYVPYNLALKGERQGDLVSTTLGAYDYLAIEYAYKPLDPLQESSQLAKIAARTTTDPELAYGTDEDADMVDPEVNRFDLGADPIAYARKRILLTQELWERLQGLKLTDGESYQRLTRSFRSGLSQLSTSTKFLSRYVGGIRQRRDHAGTGRPIFDPVNQRQQREALLLLTDALFKPDSFQFQPDFVARLATDRFNYKELQDPSIGPRILLLQRSVLETLFNDRVARRLLDAGDKTRDTSQLLKLSDLYDIVQGSIWRELKTGGNINLLRRNLQHEHLTILCKELLRPASQGPHDVHSLQRANARELVIQLRQGLKAPLDRESKAHLQECLETLSQSLNAKMERSADRGVGSPES